MWKSCFLKNQIDRYSIATGCSEYFHLSLMYLHKLHKQGSSKDQDGGNWVWFKILDGRQGDKVFEVKGNNHQIDSLLII